MGTATAHLALYKPDGTEFVDEDSQLNDNWDKVDLAVKDLDDSYPTPRPFYHVYQATAQLNIVTSTDTAVIFDGEHEDTTGNGHSTVSNPSRITPGLAGLYRAKGQAAFAGNVTGDRSCHFRVNGSKVPWRSAYGGQAANNGAGFIAGIATSETTFRLDADDYVEMWCSHNVGANLNLFADQDFTTSWMMLEFIGKA